MKFSSCVKGTLLACALSFTAFSAQAVIMDFEGVAASGQQLAVGNNYSEEGFNLFNPGNPSDAAIVGQPAQNTSGSDYYTWNSPSANNPIVLTSLTSTFFNLLSLDVGAKNSSSSNATFDITGFFVGGGSLTHNVINANAFSSLTLGWSNLTHVEFRYVTGNFGAIDNLNLNTVPEPFSVLLLGTGLLLGANFRRKN